METSPHDSSGPAEPLALHPFLTEPIVRRALEEDLAWGDVSAWGAVPAGKRAGGVFLAKASGVVCGLGVAQQVYQLLDPTFRFRPLVEDGVHVEPGVPIATLDGPAHTLLSGERVALNFTQRMSGIATKTRGFVEALAGTKTQLVDTRKTTPGLRLLEKYAVRIGGARNHRYGLADAVMIKDNHIALAGGIAAAVANIRRVAPFTVRIEVECENLDMVKEALAAEVDIIMLDNMDLEAMKEAVALIGRRAITEASGNVTLERVRAIAECGVDYISTGAITHSVSALDISLDAN